MGVVVLAVVQQAGIGLSSLLQQKNVSSFDSDMGALKEQINNLQATVAQKDQLNRQIESLKQQINDLPDKAASKQLKTQAEELKRQINTLPDRITSEKQITLKKDILVLVKDRINTRNAIYGTLVQAVGGIFFFVTAFFTWRNVKATEEKQITERFSKAVEQLGNDNIHVRLGGIYALERIANDSDKDYWQVIEVLTAYIREKSPYPPIIKNEGVVFYKSNAKPAEVQKEDIPPIPTDIQAVLTVLTRRKYAFEEGEKHNLDLRKTNLQGAHLDGANLEGADLNGANLQEASLKGANLQRVWLNGANLKKAYLNGANLQEASLNEANLEGADLSRANLEGVWLNGANLQRAYLDGFNLEGVWLQSANLEGAYLNEANLQEAYLNGANLQGAHLNVANLQRAHLDGANLEGVWLNGANLQRAHLNEANLQRAHLDGANLEGVWLNGANLQRANLDGAANLEGVWLNGANLQGAHLDRAIFKDVRNLHSVIGLTREQINQINQEKSNIDEGMLPGYLRIPESSQPQTPDP